MNENQATEAVKIALEQMGYIRDIPMDLEFMNAIQLDEIKMPELLFILEQNLSIEIPEDSRQYIVTVNDVIQLLINLTS